MGLVSDRGRLMQVDPEALLLQSHGFLVDAIPDDPVGVVDDVLVDEDGHARALVISRGWFGRRRWVVPAEEVAEICPRDRRLRLRRAARSLDADIARD